MVAGAQMGGVAWLRLRPRRLEQQKGPHADGQRASRLGADTCADGLLSLVLFFASPFHRSPNALS